MSHHVALEVKLFYASKITQVTFDGFLSCMFLLMILQGGLCYASKTTLVTLEGFLSCMCHHVVLEAGL